MFETFAHDAVDNVSAKTDFNNKTTTYAYDPLNRLLKKIPDPLLSEPAISFTYNPTGTPIDDGCERHDQLHSVRQSQPA